MDSFITAAKYDFPEWMEQNLGGSRYRYWVLSASQLKECTYMPLVLKFSNRLDALVFQLGYVH